LNAAAYVHGPLTARTRLTEEELDFSRLRQGEIIAAAGGVALFIFLFLDWFGVGGGKVSGWDALGSDISGFIVALAAGAGISLGLLAAAGRKVNIGDLPRGYLTLVLGALAALIILWRALATPEGADIEFGLFLGLAAAIAIEVGALMALREDGFEPFVAVAAPRRASSATAPAATPRTASAKKKPAARKTAARKKRPATRK
jgi:hypothetical protein